MIFRLGLTVLPGSERFRPAGLFFGRSVPCQLNSHIRMELWESGVFENILKNTRASGLFRNANEVKMPTEMLRKIKTVAHEV